MNNNKVFVLQICQIAGGEIVRNDARVFSTLEKAQRALIEFTEEEMGYIRARENDENEMESYIHEHNKEDSTDVWIAELEIE